MTEKLRFTDGRHSIYGMATGIGYRETIANHARALAHGLDILGPHYVCEVCAMCKGTTTDKYSGYAGCRYCEGTGLTQGFDRAATISQRHQVLVAASRSMLLDFDVEVV